MHSALQLLYSIPELKVFFKKINENQIKKLKGSTYIINTKKLKKISDNDDQNNKQILLALHKFFSLMEKKNIVVGNLENITVDKGGKYEGSLYGNLLSMFDDPDITYVNRKNPPGIHRDSMQFITKAFTSIITDYSNESVIKILIDLFKFEISLSFKCLNEDKIIKSLTDPYLTIELEIEEHNNNNTINDLILNYLKDENLLEENYKVEENCREKKANIKFSKIIIPNKLRYLICSIKSGITEPREAITLP